jgi:perosamine synthetase
MIPVYKPYIEKYTKSAETQLREGWVSNHGMYVGLATDLLSNILNVKHCILMNNGTAATECLLLALLYSKPEIKRVYIPNDVFIAPWSLSRKYFDISQLTALSTDYQTMNMEINEEYLLSLEENSALLCVHNLGSIVNIPRIKKIRPDLVVLEDNCEGLFGKYEGIYSGTSKSTLASACSFYGNKTITTGEGGAFFTNDTEIFNYIKKYHSHGMGETRYIHDVAGHNFRMTNIQAALLYEQLLDIDHILNLKKAIISNYSGLLSSLNPSAEIIDTEKNTEKSNWMLAARIYKGDYESLEKFMLERLIQIRPFFYNIDRHPFLSGVEQHAAKNAAPKQSFGVMLPSHPDLTFTEQQYIVSTLKKYLDAH